MGIQQIEEVGAERFALGLTLGALIESKAQYQNPETRATVEERIHTPGTFEQMVYQRYLQRANRILEERAELGLVPSR